ncbi:MarR family winged helix-turn-helix transcriptional regulator [Herbaspirillum autotrophicum]|uniref:MarR family winged helix-turn-helix transcriptional regulator n=1 Tax=Herbaspirillum autotrophicum TaxID=180195 RepID=UPI00067D5327|nr:MarR family transcriptional regulator [Herbaspirillum autotrophicum]
MEHTTTPTLPAAAIDQALLLENQLCFAMYSASLAMTKAYKKVLKNLDITYPQYLVMLVLWERDEVMVSDLGGKLFLDSGTLTPLLKRMETMGLLHRTRNAEDERRVMVKLSPEGRALREKAKALPEKLACMLPPLEQVDSLREQLKLVRKNLQEQSEE